MKTYTLKNKCLTALGSLALLTAVPSFAQYNANPTPLSKDSTLQRDSSLMNDRQVINEPSGADTDKNWSWVGLIGLAGLFGLKRRHEVRDETYRPARV